MNKNLTLFFKSVSGNKFATNNITAISYDQYNLSIWVGEKPIMVDAPELKKAKNPELVIELVIKDIISTQQSFGYLEHFIERHLNK